jgi:hypothetical protein
MDDWVVFDIDGVVADFRHRQGYLDREPADWVSFFAAAGTDPSLPDGVALALRSVAERNLLWLTGRPERTRDLTVRWLAAHGLPTEHLYMRPDADMRPARVFKADRIQQLAATKRIHLVIDDDDGVVETLTAAGWPVRQVTWMGR